MEGRTPPKGNGGETAAARTLRRDTASNGLIAVRQAARQSKSVRFTALLHHITTDLLKQSYFSLERNSAAGIDGVTWQTYGKNLEEKLKELHDEVHRGSYRARPARRTYIPKADGSKRPLSILCLEDKIVQQAVATVLEAIYEEDFLGLSYGFRPGRGQHDALDALHAGILRKQVNWVLDADIRGFFDAMAHSWIIGCGCSLDDDGSCGGGGEAGLVCSADKRCGGSPEIRTECQWYHGNTTGKSNDKRQCCDEGLHGRSPSAFDLHRTCPRRNRT